MGVLLGIPDSVSIPSFEGVQSVGMESTVGIRLTVVATDFEANCPCTHQGFLHELTEIEKILDIHG